MRLITYSDPRGIDEPAVTVALSSNVRWGTLELAQSAEIGESALSQVDLEDPQAAVTIVGLRAFAVKETAAPSNNQYIGQFVIQRRTVGRAPERGLITGTQRLWRVDLADYNWHLGKRILVDADAKRPRETPGDRLRWLLHHAENVSMNLNDYGHVTYPTSPVLDANDFRGQRATDVLADCADEGGYQYWLDFNEAHRRPELFFIDPNSSTYPASLYVSNDLADQAGSTETYFPSQDATLARDPSRMAYGVYLPYNGGSVYSRNDAVGLQYAKIDQPAPMANVKTVDRARRIAAKFLSDNADESDVVSFSIKVPAASVNHARQGQLLGVKFTHLPGYESWTAVRILRRTVAQEEQGGDLMYRVDIDAVPVNATAPQPPYTGSAFAALLYVQTDGGLGSSGNAHFGFTGDSVAGGWYLEPTVTSYFTLYDGSSDADYGRITVSRPMTVRLHAGGDWTNVVGIGDRLTFQIKVNGAVVGDVSTTGNNGFTTGHMEVDVPSYDLAGGDVVTFGFAATGSYTGPSNSAGGTNSTFLRVGRGTQVWNSGGVTWTGPS